MDDIERWAERAHEVYLEAARRLGWPIRPEVAVELDRALARRFWAEIEPFLEAVQAALEALNVQPITGPNSWAREDAEKRVKAKRLLRRAIAKVREDVEALRSAMTALEQGGGEGSA